MAATKALKSFSPQYRCKTRRQIMAKKPSTKRTEVKDIPKSKRELTGKDLRKVKGGLAAQELSRASEDQPTVDYGKIKLDY